MFREKSSLGPGRVGSVAGVVQVPSPADEKLGWLGTWRFKQEKWGFNMI